MKAILAVCVISMSFVLFAVESQPSETEQKSNSTNETTQVEDPKVRRLIRTGGLIARPGTRSGEIVYVNCQTAAEKAWLEESIAYFTDETRFTISLKDGSFDILKPAIQGNVSLFVVDDAALPSLLVAPENKWAMVNVAKLKTDQVPFFKTRVLKELARGFAMLCGAASSDYPRSLTCGITKPEDLDDHVDARLPVDVIARFAPNLKPFGVTPALMVTYRKACTEGWAPAPTNDIQKAIWEKEHAIPKNPMKIEFDPKKGR